MESNTKDRRYVNLGNGVQRTQNLNMPRRGEVGLPLTKRWIAIKVDRARGTVGCWDSLSLLDSTKTTIPNRVESRRCPCWAASIILMPASPI